MKLFSKIATAFVGIAMAIGVGVAASVDKTAKVANAESVTISYSDISGMTSSASYQTGTASGFTFEIENGLLNGHLRVYKGKFLLVTAPANYDMTEIVFTCTANGNAQYGPGCFVLDESSSGTYTAGTGKTGTWSGKAENVKLIASSNQVRITSFAITYQAQSTDSPKITLSKSSLTFINGGASQSITATPNDKFTATPTLSVDGDTAYVNVSFDGLTINVSPTAVGEEEVTIKAVHNDEIATATLSIEVLDSHGRVADDPFTVAEAITAIDGGISSSDKVYVEGIISQIDTTEDKFKGQICYWISDDGSTTNQFEIYWGKAIGNVDFTSLSDIELGATVVNYGPIKKYNTTYEFDSGSYLISYEAPSKTLSSISLSGDYQTSFELNETFNYTGLVVTAHYSNGSEETVSPTSVSSPDMTSIGEKTVTVSYTENEVTKEAEYNIEVTAPVQKWTVSFLPGEGSGTMPSAQVNDGSSYTLPTCTFTAPEGKEFDYWEVDGAKTIELESVTSDVEATAIWKDKAPVTDVDDVLNNGNTIKETTTSYSSWTTETMDSGAVYSGQSAGGNDSIQLRSSNSNSGIVSTTSGGTLVSIEIAFNSNTAATRTVSVYGNNSVYTNPTDLYDNNKKGTLLGEVNVDNGATQTITVEGDYQYVGIRSKSGALYLDSITIKWNSSVTPKVLTGITVSGAKTDFTVGEEFVTTGLVVTAQYDDSSESIISTGYDVDSSAVNKDAEGTYNIVVTYEGFQDNYDVTYTAPAPVVVATYKKVEANLENFSGDYLIVYEGDSESYAFDGSLETLDAAANRVEVTITNDKIELSEAHEFHIGKKEGGYSIQSASGKYIGKTADSNGLDSKTTDDYTNSISYSGETPEMKIAGSGGAVLRYNSANNQNRFRFYSSSSYTGQKAVSLYKQVDDKADEFSLDLLNMTNASCSAYVDGTSSYEEYKTIMTGVWTTLADENHYGSLSADEISRLVSADAVHDGTTIEQAMARYDFLCIKYVLTQFISGRTVLGLGVITSTSNNTINTNAALISVIIVAVISVSAIGVLLVVKKRKYHN